MHLIASGWYHSGLSCDAQTALILYAIPLTGDALQFIIIDKLQAAAQCRAVHTPCTHLAHTMHDPCTHHARITHMQLLYRRSASSRELWTPPAILRTWRAALPSAIRA